MKHIYRAAYVALTLGFIRKLLCTLIPDTNSGMYAYAWHPNRNQPDGVIQENLLIVVIARFSSIMPTGLVPATGVVPGPRWTTLYLPISKIVAYATRNDIHCVMPLWSAAMFQFHGTSESADALHTILAEMHTSTSHLPNYNRHRDILTAVDMIRRQIN